MMLVMPGRPPPPPASPAYSALLGRSKPASPLHHTPFASEPLFPACCFSWDPSLHHHNMLFSFPRPFFLIFFGSPSCMNAVFGSPPHPLHDAVPEALYCWALNWLLFGLRLVADAQAVPKWATSSYAQLPLSPFYQSETLCHFPPPKSGTRFQWKPRGKLNHASGPRSVDMVNSSVI